MSRAEEFLCVLKEYNLELQLVDLFYTDRRHLSKLLAACVAYAQQRGKSLSFWLSKDHPLLGHCTSQKLEQREVPQRLHAITNQAAYSGVLADPRSWHYVMGDSDVF